MPSLFAGVGGGRWCAVLSLVFALGLAGCASTVSPPPKETKPSPPVVVDKPPPLVFPAPVPLSSRATVKAALLLPLSGSNAPLGQSMLKAAELAVFELADPRFQLLPVDTAGTPDGARQAAERARQDGADIMIGPVLATEVQAVAPIARMAGVPVVAFTSDPAAVGRGIFSLGFTPEAQIARVIRFARGKGLSRFALLVRDDDYGRAMAQAFDSTVAAQGGTVAGIGFYKPNDQDYTATVQKFLASTRTGPDRVGFDALLIPETGSRLQTLVSLAFYYGVEPSKVRLLGNLLWNDKALAGDASLQGSWYPAIPEAGQKAFEERYTKAFGGLSPRFASLAALSYEATALAAVLARQPDGNYGAQALGNPDGFAGVGGLFRFKPDGTVERGLEIREIGPDGSVVVEPGPVRF